MTSLALTYRLTEPLGPLCVVDALSGVMYDVEVTPEVMSPDVTVQR